MTKQELRAHLIASRDAIPREERTEKDAKIATCIAKSHFFRSASSLLLYAPIGSEIRLTALVHLAWERRIPVAFPVCDRETTTLTFRQLRPGEKLVPGLFGIYVPPEGSPQLTPDERSVCIVPGLCYDREGYRIGYGKGYYDRFLAGFPGVSMGVCYENRLADRLPREAHDLPVDLLVTDRGIRDFTRPRPSGVPTAAERTAPASGVTVPARNAAPSSGIPASAGGSADALSKPPISPARTANSLSHGTIFDTRTANSASDAPNEPHPANAANASLAPLPEHPKTGADPDANRGTSREKTVKSPSGSNRSASSESFAPVSTAREPIKPLHAPALLVLAVFFLLFVSRIIERNITSRGGELAAVVLLQILSFFLPALVYLRVRGDALRQRLRLRGFRPKHLWLCFCVLVMMITGSLLLSILTGGISSLGVNFTLYNTFVARMGNPFETFYVLLAYAILPAICEELVFRSILCAEYERTGTPLSIAASACFFAMLHFSFPHFPNYLYLGILLAAVLYATRSAVAPMLLHFLYNLFCLFGQPYLSAFYVNAGSNEIFLFLLIFIFLLFSAFAAGEARKIYHIYAKKNLSSQYTVPMHFKTDVKPALRTLLSPATAACLLFWLILSIVSSVR